MARHLDAAFGRAGRTCGGIATVHDRDTKRDDVRAGRIRRRLAELANLGAAAYEEKLLGKVAEEMFATLTTKWRAEETTLRAELAVLTTSITTERLLTKIREPFQLLEVVADQYLRRNREERSTLVRSCVSNLMISRGSVSIGWTSPFNTMAKLGDRHAWLGREDSNLRMAAPKAAALPLGDSPG